ncbi:MAG: TIGR03915 family putative DNA repair protein [Thermoplasmatota archaeon]
MHGSHPVAVVFDGSFDGLLCIADRMHNENIMVESVTRYATGTRPLCDSLTVSTDGALARRIQQQLREKLTRRQCRRVLYAFLADDDEVYLPLLRYIQIGLKDPERLDDLTDETIQMVYEAAQRVARERHRMLGFARFARLRDDSYFAVIAPRHDVLPLLGGHFRQRFPDRHWYIYDQGRRTLLIHDDTGLAIEKVTSLSLPGLHPEEHRYQRLWQTFFDSVAIGERVSYERQRSFVPLFYRGCMTEFVDGALTPDI